VLAEEVSRRLKAAGVRPSKERSQHFLIDDMALATIVRQANLSEKDTVLEIGAGVGTLTEALAKRAGRVVTYEPDLALAKYLREELAPQFPHLEIRDKYINRYELEVAVSDLGPAPFKLVTNLPYSITSEFLVYVLSHMHHFSQVIVMLQQEVAKRLTANPGGKAYGSLTVFARTFAYGDELMFVPCTAFHPVPQVDSILMRLQPLSQPPEVADKDTYFRVVHGAFAHRRKTITNAMMRAFPHLNRTEILRRLSHTPVMPERRGDTLTQEEFIQLTEVMRQERKA